MKKFSRLLLVRMDLDRQTLSCIDDLHQDPGSVSDAIEMGCSKCVFRIASYEIAKGFLRMFKKTQSFMDELFTPHIARDNRRHDPFFGKLGVFSVEYSVDFIYFASAGIGSPCTSGSKFHGCGIAHHNTPGYSFLSLPVLGSNSTCLPVGICEASSRLRASSLSG